MVPSLPYRILVIIFSSLMGEGWGGDSKNNKRLWQLAGSTLPPPPALHTREREFKGCEIMISIGGMRCYGLGVKVLRLTGIELKALLVRFSTSFFLHSHPAEVFQ
jgi:hypothetical protein